MKGKRTKFSQQQAKALFDFCDFQATEIRRLTASVKKLKQENRWFKAMLYGYRLKTKTND